MANEVFRFVNLRAPRLTSEPADGDTPNPTGGTPPILREAASTAFVAELAKLKVGGASRAEMEGRARKFIGSERYAFRSPLKFDVNPLDRWLARQPQRITTEQFAAGVKDIFGASAEELVMRNEVQDSLERLHDSLIALTVAPDSPGDKARITRYLRLIDVMASLSTWPGKFIDQDALTRRRLLLPPSVFPLPASIDPHDAEAVKADKERRELRDKQDKLEAALSQQIADSRQAIGELTTALRADTNDLRRAAASAVITAAPPSRPTRSEPIARSAEGAVAPVPGTPVASGVLTTKGVGLLSAKTKTVLGQLGVAHDFVDVPYAVQALEGKVASAASQLFQGKGSRVVTRIGNRWLPGVFTGGASVFDRWRVPGPCMGAGADAPGGAPTVPATSLSDIRPIGIADLLLVRQQIKRYEAGEIAHVENVMIGETRHRTHRETTQTVEQVMVETETTKEESRDLQTTDRFELQQESAQVLKEESSRDIALSISASYGPFASGTANISSHHGDSKETTTKNAMQYAREVTDKAVKKLEERALERRTVTTTRTVDDVSKHGFDNKDGVAHVQGIYRWLDKIYEAKVVSYGLRMMFELVVPEPSAFYRHALGAVPPEGLTLERPEPPGYCSHPSHTFTDLVPGDLSEANYQFWVSKYGATGVEPPPPLHRTIGVTMAEEPADGDRFVATMNNELQVPAGYRAERAWVNGEGILWVVNDPPGFISFVVGRTRIGMHGSGAMNGEDGAIPVVANGYSVASYAASIEVLCTRTTEAFAAWQMATFTSIMGAYNDLKSQYDAALARLELNAQAGTGIAGRNPLVNRDIERRELKRASLSLFTGQHFDDFDAMRRGAPPHGYPQMNLAEAKLEGEYIKFFEQAFEWGNMSYRFYPYFWARKSEWPNYLRQDDTDPLFGQFLQAGAARVQVPVRPGFEEAVTYFLQTGNKPWEEDDTAFHIEGQLYLSMVDEITDEQLGAFTKGVGTIAVQQGSATITGDGTEFDADLHLDRDVMIQRRIYRVAAVVSPTEITLDRPYQDASTSGMGYSFGGRIVGDPWEVKVPTSLVFLQEGNELPEFDVS